MKSLVGWCASASLALIGCGPVDDSGVSETKKLSDITPADAQKLCEYQTDLMREALGTERNYCIGRAFAAGVDSEGCEDAVEECMSTMAYEAALADEGACDTATVQRFVLVPATCDLSVGQYEACLETWHRRMGTFTQTLSCADLDSAEEPAPPEQCAAAAEQCPTLQLR